jgi:hypothetical protein
METKKVEITKMIAAEGHTLINKDGVTMGKRVFLSVNDSIENWSEITDAEADEIRARLEAQEEAEAEAVQE